jgi:hypothetical protein
VAQKALRIIYLILTKKEANIDFVLKILSSALHEIDFGTRTFFDGSIALILNSS